MQDMARHMQTHQQDITASPPIGLDMDLSLMDSTLVSGVVNKKNLDTAKKAIRNARKIRKIYLAAVGVLMALDAIKNRKKEGNELTSRDLDNLIKSLQPLLALIPKAK